MNGLRNLRNRSELLQKGAGRSAILAGVSLLVGLVSMVFGLWWFVYLAAFFFVWGVVFAIFLWQLWYMSTFFSWTAEAIAQSQEDQTNRLLAALAPEYVEALNQQQRNTRVSSRTPAPASSAGEHWSRSSVTGAAPAAAPVAGNRRVAKVETISDATCLSCGRRLNAAGHCPAGC